MSARATHEPGRPSATGSARELGAPRTAACASCLRRSLHLCSLGGVLDLYARDVERMLALLALEEEQLLAATRGRRRELPAAERAPADPAAGAETDAHVVCRHDPRFPRSLRCALAPRALYAQRSCERLLEPRRAPAVAIVGSTRASDYGVQVARSLARGLAASGVTVVAALADGVARGAHAGALEAGGGSIAVCAGGLRVAAPASLRALQQRVAALGCVVSELPAGCRGRRWGALAAERTVVALAQLTVVVEAHDSPRSLLAANVASTLGRRIAAVPGRVSSPLSAGPHALLREGVTLVRGTRDLLQLLNSAREEPDVASAQRSTGEGAPPTGLEPALRATLDAVGAGRDTPQQLLEPGVDPQTVLARLTELELLGLLARGDGGRYVPTEPI